MFIPLPALNRLFRKERLSDPEELFELPRISAYENPPAPEREKLSAAAEPAVDSRVSDGETFFSLRVQAAEEPEDRRLRESLSSSSSSFSFSHSGGEEALPESGGGRSLTDGTSVNADVSQIAAYAGKMLRFLRKNNDLLKKRSDEKFYQ